MSGDVVARARAALEGITDGPWEWSVTADDSEQLVSKTPPGPEVLGAYAPYDAASVNVSEADAAFIAAARDLVPELADRVEALEAEVGQLRTLAALYRVTLDHEYTDEELRNSPYTGAFDDAVVAGPDEYRSGPCGASHPYSSGFICSKAQGHDGKHGYAGCFWTDPQ